MVKVFGKNAAPFIKWAGGKSKLAPIINDIIKQEIQLEECTTYVEPFVGGGAMFFYIANKYQPEELVISDVNMELINTYKAIQQDVEKLMIYLDELQSTYMNLGDLDAKKAYFYKIREAFNQKKTAGNPEEVSYRKASYFIFLNKTCFNGLYRENQKGLFNVPFGQRVNLNLYDKENLFAVNEVLQRTKIYVQDYQLSIKYADKGTFFYFDPPYRPLTKTANFTSYSRSGFNDDNQKELADFCSEIKKLGAHFALSNSDPHNENVQDMFFDELYKDFNIQRISANRAVGAKSGSRGKVSEIVVIG